MKNYTKSFLKEKSSACLLTFYGGFFLFSLLSVQTSAQRTASGFKSFTVEVKDTVYQGESFQVTYVLEATNWKNVEVPKFVACKEVSRKYETQDKRPFSRLTARHELVVSQVGKLTIPATTATVDNRKVHSGSKTIYVAPNPKAVAEMPLAHQWLRDHDVPADSCVLQIEQSDDELVLFADKYHGKFVVVAREAFWDILDYPVLAWSAESSIFSIQDSKNNESAYTTCIYPYAVQLRRLKAASRTCCSDSIFDAMTSEISSLWSSKVTPLLGAVAWGQKEPFNYLSPIGPNGEKTLIGCVPVSMAQVMMYHRFPERGVGGYVYTAPDMHKYRVDYEQFSPAWTELKPTYEKNDTVSTDAIAQLMMMIGLSVDAQYGENSTATNFYNMKSSFCSNWGYSGRAMLFRNDSTGRMFLSMRRDLEAKRPCIISNDSHSMVCDGYDAGFWHLNFGWGGYCNGWYRSISCDSFLDSYVGLFSTALTGIEPQRKEVGKSVTVQKDGMLAELLTDEEKETVTKLTVSGPLNSADMKLLRWMAGSPNSEDLLWRGGALSDLDLSDAYFINDKQPYLTEPASDKWTTTSTYYDRNFYGIGQSSSSQMNMRVNQKSYDMKNMGDKEWNLFCKNIGIKQDGYYYERKGKTVYVNYVTRKYSISPYMFSGCSSLKNVIVPANTRYIQDCAFFNCPALQRVTLSKSIYQIDDYVFSYCNRFEGVICPVKIPHVSRTAFTKFPK